MPVHGLDIPVVTGERRLLDSTSKVKELDGRVIRGGDKFGVGRTETEVANRVTVGLNDLDVVEVGLPVLDDSILVCREQPVIAVRV